jgi:2-C-methyl-D-erythritol 4-phosphate cytidylyltransferase
MIPGIQKYAIIVAGGSGTRMNSPTPKQFIPIDGKPVLMHTIQRFADFSSDIRLILVLPSSQMKEWIKLCTQYQFNLNVKLVEGGETRFHSVKNGLDAIDNLNSLVAIHDGVRPFIKNSIIGESFKQAEIFGSAIACVSLKDSIRYVDINSNRAEDRTKFKLIQTPQTFQSSLIKTAYQTTTLFDFTDDAGVLESAGNKINLIEGSYENIKITTPEDLVIAEAILNNSKLQQKN